MEQFLDTLHQAFPESRLDDEGFWHSGESAPEESTDLCITPLSQYTLLSVIGPDASKFLQGQTTCDWNTVNSEQATLGSYCNIKGRVMSSFLGFINADNSIQLRVRNDIFESSRDILAKYIVFSKAKLHANHDQLTGIGIFGSRAKQTLSEHFGELPDGYLKSVSKDHSCLIQLDDKGHRFECWLTADSTAGFWSAVAPLVTVCDSTLWQAANISQGLAEVSALTQDMFIPQMLNLQLVGAVSFKKGCYTGQEIVARMQYRGKLKRRMYRAEFSSDVLPQAGAELLVGDNGQSVGNIVLAAKVRNRVQVLAVITEEALASGDVHLPQSSQALEILTLPYSVEG